MANPNRVAVPIQVTIHEEDGVWWAESSGLQGFTAAADSRDELIRRCEAVRLEASFTFIGPWRYGDAS